MKKKFVFCAVLLSFFFFAGLKQIIAQDISQNLLQYVPQAAEKLKSEDVNQRVSILNDLVLPVPSSCTGALYLPFKLEKDDYLFVVQKILDKDLNLIDEKSKPNAWRFLTYLIEQFQMKEFLEPISVYLSDSNPSVQYSIIITLQHLQAREFDAKIAPLLYTTPKYIQDVILETLISFRSKQAIPKLLIILNDKSSSGRYWAIDRLVELDAREAASSIAGLLQDKELNLRYWALDALVKLDSHKYYAPLFKKELWEMVENGESVKTNFLALAVLVGCKEEKALQLTIKYATASDSYVRDEILRPLVEMKAVVIIKPLIETLKDKTILGGDIGTDSNIRHSLITALVNLKAKEVIPLLRNYLNEPNELFQRGAAQALGVLEVREAVDDLLNVFYLYLPMPPDRINNNTFISAEAALALAKIGDKKAWKGLIEAAANPHYPYRSEIIRQLNRHIRPDMWQKVKQLQAASTDYVALPKMVEMLSQTSGIPITLEMENPTDFVQCQRQSLSSEKSECNLKFRPWAGVTLLDALNKIPSDISSGTLPEKYTFIFDKETIRILTVKQATEWWKKNILK